MFDNTARNSTFERKRVAETPLFRSKTVIPALTRVERVSYIHVYIQHPYIYLCISMKAFIRRFRVSTQMCYLAARSPIRTR